MGARSKLRRKHHFWNNSIWASVGSDFQGIFRSLTSSRKWSFIYRAPRKVLPFHSVTFYSQQAAQHHLASTYDVSRSTGAWLRKEDAYKRTVSAQFPLFPGKTLLRAKLELKVRDSCCTAHKYSLEMHFQKCKFRLDVFIDTIQLVSQMWPK